MICVSHSLPMIESLCEQVLLLDHGHMVRVGPTAEVIPAYYEAAYLEAHRARDLAAIG